jgi:RNA polymerase sigma-70 factor (ECF subfamily)
LTDSDPDEALLIRVGRREAAAFKEIAERKLPRILSLATRMLDDRNEAEDIAQEAFLRIWKYAARWKPGRARFDTWLHRVVLNLCYDRLRSREDPTEVLPEQIDTALMPADVMDASAKSARVAAALAALPDRQREALVLHYYQELPNVEAAALMGVSVEALESLLARARKGMRATLIGSDSAKEAP